MFMNFNMANGTNQFVQLALALVALVSFVWICVNLYKIQKLGKGTAAREALQKETLWYWLPAFVASVAVSVVLDRYYRMPNAFTIIF